MNERYNPSSVSIFEGEPLNIFPIQDSTSKPISYLQTWDKIEERQLQKSFTIIPQNAFDEKIVWTKEGKLWSFPIDNEVGLEEEKKTGFHEHIFLEKYIADWCPRKGPLKHFMDLVVAGLSKNPYISVDRKKNHIEWYRNYFANKIDLLKETGMVENSFKIKKNV